MTKTVLIVLVTAACGGAPPPPCPRAQPALACEGAARAARAPSDAANGTSYRDADGDMILDECDRCPDAAESFNGYQDEDGCPERLIVTEVEDMILDFVYFEHQQATIAEPQLEIVRGEAEFWKRHLEVERIVCIGRTADNEKDPEQLSFLRAKAFCDKLEEYGISPARLVAYGVAYRSPRSPGKTGDFERAKERSAIAGPMLDSGRKILIWDGRTLVPAKDQPRYKPEPPPASKPDRPICPAWK